MVTAGTGGRFLAEGRGGADGAGVNLPTRTGPDVAGWYVTKV